MVGHIASFFGAATIGHVVGNAGGPKRVVPMSKRVQALLEPYFAMNDSWFVGERQIQKLVKVVSNRAQITSVVTPHVLRHTFATLALQKGISLAAVQKMLGHDRLAGSKQLVLPVVFL